MTYKVLIQTLLDRWKSISLLSVLFFVFMAYSTTVYPETAKLTNANDVLDSPAIQMILGKIHFDNSFESYVSLKALGFAGLITGGFTAWLAASFLSGEIDHRTIELLLAQPLRRGRLVVARYTALGVIALLLMLAVLAGIVAGIAAMSIETSIPWLAYALAYMWVFTLAFGGISLFISALSSDGRRAALTSLGVLVIMYFMETIGSVVDLLGPIRYLSLFHYARYNEMLMTKTMSLVDLGVLLSVAVVFVALAAYVFRGRDINVG
jgi:ABC-2 type transport system permease protein